jgi:hypothetical protein
MERFYYKKILSLIEKLSSPVQRWRCSCKIKNRRIGSRANFVLVPEANPKTFEFTAATPAF